MSRRITIDPITRLEGHGKVEIFLDEQGNVANAYLQIPELRGFENFCVGRAAEEMPRITTRICGVCPTAHHMASALALDALYGVEPPAAAHKVRELLYNLFIFEDHLLHFFFLGGPDFLVGSAAPAEERNILGVIQRVGHEIGRRILSVRKEARDLIEEIGGKVIHPVFALPGGISKPVDETLAERIRASAPSFIELARYALDTFAQEVLEKPNYLRLLRSDAFTQRTHSMGLVDDDLRVTFYRGRVRVVSCDGEELALFEPADYRRHIAEHVEPWSYVKFPYLQQFGWKGFAAGADSGIYRVAPLARLNASEGMATAEAQLHHDQLYNTMGGKPAHATLAFHWARLVEALQAAETVQRLAADPEIASPEVRELPEGTPPGEGVGIVEAPRGTLIHHYCSNADGILTYVNLLVATVHNSASIQMSIRSAAESLISCGVVNDAILNTVEMAFRAYDPCQACASHSLPGEMPLALHIHDFRGERIQTLRRGIPERGKR